MTTRPTRTVPCRKCGTPRTWYGRMKPDSMCRACHAKSVSKKTWPYRQDTVADKAERKAKRWVTPSERPTIVGLRIGTMTKWGKVEGRGMNSQHGRYYVFLRDGISTQVPAEQVEAP
jgi:hypothetical protein